MKSWKEEHLTPKQLNELKRETALELFLTTSDVTFEVYELLGVAEPEVKSWYGYRLIGHNEPESLLAAYERNPDLAVKTFIKSRLRIQFSVDANRALDDRRRAADAKALEKERQIRAAEVERQARIVDNAMESQIRRVEAGLPPAARDVHSQPYREPVPLSEHLLGCICPACKVRR
jgi:hypothetical protein